MSETDYAALRLKMVDSQLRTTDVTDLGVLDAFLAVPREVFVPKASRALAYIDEDIRVSGVGADARFLMEPSPLAKLIQLAAIRPTDVVLDAGSATGYASAIMSRLASAVIALDSDPALSATAGETLAGLGCDNVVTVTGPIDQGWPSEAPYDVIFINGAVDAVPPALFLQLRDGGRLITVEGMGNAGRAVMHVRDGDNVSVRRAFNAAVKPLPGFQKAPEFAF